MGVDNIHNKMIKNAGIQLKLKLTDLFNSSLNTGIQADAWTKDSISPIPKPNKDIILFLPTIALLPLLHVLVDYFKKLLQNDFKPTA